VLESGGDEAGSGEGGKGLLYHSFELYTLQRRVTQMVLLGAEADSIKERVNDSIKAMMTRKLADIDKIAEKRERIIEIFAELGVEDEPEMVTLDAAEVAESVLEVTDDEVIAEKVLTEAEQRALEEKLRQDEEARRRAGADDSASRALKDMMGGTLDRKKAGDLEDLVREPWMSLPPDQLSEEQQKKLKEFEAKVAAYEEEQEKARKAFELEYRQLKTQIEGICSDFDVRLQELFFDRIKAEIQVHVRDLMIIRLAASLNALCELEERQETLSRKLASAKMDTARKQTALAEVKRLADAEGKTHEALVAEDRALERGFRREFGENEEFYDAMLKVFRNRTHAAAAATAGAPSASTGISSKRSRKASLTGRVARSSDDGAPRPAPRPEPAPSNDPFTDKHAKDGTEQFREAPYEASDKPDGMDMMLWERLLEYRELKLAKEAEVKEHAQTLADVTRELAVLTDQDDGARELVQELMGALAEVHASSTREALDLDMFINLKQGQVEINTDMAFEEYASTCAFMDRVNVERLNAEIQVKGGEKVAILEQVKEARKDIYNLEWANKHGDMTIVDLTQKIKDLQLLRVTKGLQGILKDEEGSQVQQEESRLQTRLGALAQVHSEQLKNLTARRRKLETRVAEKAAENALLQEKTAAATLLMEERRKMTEMRSSPDAAEQAAARNRGALRNIMTNRKLNEIVSQQAEEVAFLSSELERLQRRNFPSFANPNRTLPDIRRPHSVA